jgi:hypothetical protein
VSSQKLLRRGDTKNWNDVKPCPRFLREAIARLPEEMDGEELEKIASLRQDFEGVLRDFKVPMAM